MIPLHLQHELEKALKSARTDGNLETVAKVKKAWKEAGRHRNGTTQGIQNAWEEFDTVMETL